MEKINIKGNDDTPSVLFDADNGVFELSGRSMPEDVEAFYDPLITWLEQYAEKANQNTEFVFKMKYFNTASSKMILDILMILEEIHETGKKVVVKWHYIEQDEDMEEAGEEYADIVEIPFEHFSYKQ